jgi:hypothetical protein
VSLAPRHTSASHTCIVAVVFDALAAGIAMDPVMLFAPRTLIDSDRIVLSCTLAARKPPRYLCYQCEGRRVVERMRVLCEAGARPAGNHQFLAEDRA